MPRRDDNDVPLVEERTRKAHISELQHTPVPKKSFLIQIYGPSLGRNYPIDNDTITIGRDPANTIQLDQENVSRHHARLLVEPPAVYIQDLGSTNGTYLNDVPIQRERLRHGDLIKIGGVVFKFVSGGNIEGLYHEEIYRMTITDGLTQVANKRYLYEFLEREISRTIRFGRPLSVIMFDIDHFKRINDRYGHLAGDYVLKQMCKLIGKHTRPEELLARYGGEEFVVVLPETSLSSAATVAEKFRLMISEHEFEFAGEKIPVTISLGCAELSPMAADPALFLQEADARLYEAKRAGRNRVVA